MKKKFAENNVDSDDYDGDDCSFTMYDFEPELGLEIVKAHGGTLPYVVKTDEHLIHSIAIKGNFIASEMTIYFGNYAHIHLSNEQLEAFVEGIKKVYKHVSSNSCSINCEKCGLRKTFRSKKRFLYGKGLAVKCPKCGHKTRGH